MKKRKQDTKGTILIRVGRAGIGRMSFAAWEADNVIRDDAESLGAPLFDTPGEALAALGRKMDRDACIRGWRDYDEVDE